MTYDEAVTFWFGRINYEHKPPRPSDLNLDRIRTLLDLLGRPQDRYRILHIAGSKGKGSTSALLASILGRAGFRVGLFTSPHLVSVRERMQVDGQPISEAEIAQATSDIAAACARHRPAAPGVQSLEQTLTFFEVATALGYLHFARRRVELAVVEVGMGGRFDSTNVCRPLASLLTSISFDHTRQLGNTLALIAGEKAGIIKKARPTLSGVRAPEAREVIARTARLQASPLRQIDVDYRYRHFPARIGGGDNRPNEVEVVTWKRAWPRMAVGLVGEHQARNAALAVAAVELMREQGLVITDKAVAEGLARVHWPARLECLGRDPLVLLDCAHNVASAEALAQALQISYPLQAEGRRILVFAGSRDKDLAGMLRILTPLFDYILLTSFATNPRNVTPEQLRDMLPEGVAAPVQLVADARDAFRDARQMATPDDLICITGSIFLAGELRPILVAESEKTSQPQSNA